MGLRVLKNLIVQYIYKSNDHSGLDMNGLKGKDLHIDISASSERPGESVHIWRLDRTFIAQIHKV